MEPILTPTEMAAVDAAAPEPVQVLIERAGAAVARAAIDLLGGTYGRRVVVLAGKGNNGADGRSAARRLAARGVRTRVIAVGSAPEVLPAADLVIDAAFGTGFRGRFQPPGLAHPAQPVLAVDLPSGLDGLTGEAHGSPWRAERTVTFAAWKPGLLLGSGPELAGEVTVADIGLQAGAATAWRITAADLPALLPRRPRDTHKWRAAVRVIAGSPGMTGAAHLVTAAAMRSGAGYVRLSTPGGDHDPTAPTEAVVEPLPGARWEDEAAADLDRFSALAIGPGLGAGRWTAAAVRSLVASTRVPTVVDGDGLRALGSVAEAAACIGTRPEGAGPVVLTPHEGEHQAMVGTPPGVDRFAAVRTLAAELGAVVLLKGPTTVVAEPGGQLRVVVAGDARLATAGTGDVLTGILAGLLAGGTDALGAAAAAAYVHATAGDLAWDLGLVAHDLVDHLPAALRHLSGA